MLTHDDVIARGVMDRYVARRLDGTTLEAFEEHLIECAECQLAVRVGIAARAELRAPSRSRWRAAAAIIGVAAAAAISVVILRRPDPALQALGTVGEAPAWNAVEVRGGSLAEAESLFVAGTDAYTRREWSGARADLAQAEARGLAHPALPLLLGIAELMEGDAREAEVTLARVIATGDRQYAEEAAYYRAKSLLQLGRGDEALTLLRTTPFLLALPLADSVEGILAR